MCSGRGPLGAGVAAQDHSCANRPPRCRLTITRKTKNASPKSTRDLPEWTSGRSSPVSATKKEITDENGHDHTLLMQKNGHSFHPDNICARFRINEPCSAPRLPDGPGEHEAGGKGAQTDFLDPARRLPARAVGYSCHLPGSGGGRLRPVVAVSPNSRTIRPAYLVPSLDRCPVMVLLTKRKNGYCCRRSQEDTPSNGNG